MAELEEKLSLFQQIAQQNDLMFDFNDVGAILADPRTTQRYPFLTEQLKDMSVIDFNMQIRKLLQERKERGLS